MTRKLLDIRNHGEYLSMDWPIFKFVCDLTEDAARTLYRNAHLLDPQDYRELGPEEFTPLSINKGFRVVMEMNGQVFAIHLRDGRWSMHVAPANQFNREYQERRPGMTNGARTAFGYAPWVIK